MGPKVKWKLEFDFTFTEFQYQPDAARKPEQATVGNTSKQLQQVFGEHEQAFRRQQGWGRQEAVTSSRRTEF